MENERIKASKESWTTQPMPEKNNVIPMEMTLEKDEMAIIQMGSIPTSMGVKWFMYCDEDTIRYYLSYSGVCVYEAKYEYEGDMAKITELRVNRDPNQYGCTDDNEDRWLFSAMIRSQIHPLEKNRILKSFI